jgi:hypothetical protein
MMKTLSEPFEANLGHIYDKLSIRSRADPGARMLEAQNCRPVPPMAQRSVG